jgi:hypothetical protein
MSLETLKPKVAELIEKAQSGGGLPDWDDDSPIIYSGKAYVSKNIHWEITEEGTFRWVIDYPSTKSTDNQGLLCNGNQVSILMNVRPEIVPFLPKIRQYYAPDGLSRIEGLFMVNCERIRVPTTLTNIPSITGMSAIRELDMSADVYTTIYNYYCQGMYALEKVTLSPLITTIPSNCFQNCYSLNEINLENITEYKPSAFNQCFMLNKPLTFNAGLTAIGDQGFYRTGLSSVIFQNNLESLPTISSNAFGQCYLLKDIYVPWAEGEVANAPWGATNATIHYNYNAEV